MNPFYFILVLAFSITFLIVYLVDGGFQDNSLEQGNYGYSNYRALLDLHRHHEFVELPEDVDWSQYAYVQYATNQNYLCNNLMIFDQLKTLDTNAERVLIYPNYWGEPDVPEPPAPKGMKYIEKNKKTTELLRLARDKYSVKLKPVKELEFMAVERTWKSSFTKLMAFNETDYKRVIVLDADAFVLKSLDYLFLHERANKSSPISAPTAYWQPPRANNQSMLTSALMVIDPSFQEFEKVLAAAQTRHIQEYDMDLINDEYEGIIEPLPHKGLFMLSAEFRSTDHTKYLGSELWNGIEQVRNAAYIHFSDWPFPKVSFQSSFFFFFFGY
ncbi:hypothetical protein D0Z00_001289 [Geotrichum galactomycetum]|uniref:Uncharacterized protein n=1 Tax=Geotrichum galactomycetum TaxID=27317 RepID=A0ACB6V7A9_9ASCO|nr:hypothetical protein D0Z00_001289 [Geotrichum candidum]